MLITALFATLIEVILFPFTYKSHFKLINCSRTAVDKKFNVVSSFLRFTLKNTF